MLPLERRAMEFYLRDIWRRPWFRGVMEVAWLPAGVRINDQPCVATLADLQRVLRVFHKGAS